MQNDKLENKKRMEKPLRLKTSEVLILVAVVALGGALLGFWTIPGLNITPLNTGGGGVGGNDLTNTLDFVLIDKYAGTAQNSMTIKVYRGQILQESCTTASDGTIETVNQYKSGELIKLLLDEGSNEIWIDVVVPNHDPNKVQASDPTPVHLEGSDHPTVTDLVHDESASAIADAGKLNYTAKGSSELITYTTFVSADNSGLLASTYDPLDGYTPQVVLYVTCSDTTVSVDAGMQGSFMKGASIVYYKVVDVSEVSKWKVGNNYIFDGTASFAFNLNLASCTGTSATVQIDLYEADDPAYYASHYTHAPYATVLCESTIAIDNT